MSHAPPALSRLMLFALAALIGVVVWTVKPWQHAASAVRPDTGTLAETLAPEDIERVLGVLLLRVYAAFGQIDEGAIYDGLATAVASDLLTELYLQRRAVQAQGPEIPEDPEAGVAEITDLRLDDWLLLDRTDSGYNLTATWTVVGIIGHSDHRHERINKYEARLTIGPADGAWRLTDFDLDQVARKEAPLFFEAFE
ncbi:MAG: hypothetical protein AAGE38_14795 [Pseudomonadota bacterium]